MNENDKGDKGAPLVGSGIKVFASPNKGQAIFELHVEGQARGWIGLEAPEVEEFQRKIAETRALLTDRVVLEVDFGARVHAVYNPAWRITKPFSRDPLPAGKLLLLRHPGIGWLSFLFPPHEANDLGTALLEHKRSPTGTVED